MFVKNTRSMEEFVKNTRSMEEFVKNTISMEEFVNLQRSMYCSMYNISMRSSQQAVKCQVKICSRPMTNCEMRGEDLGLC